LREIAVEEQLDADFSTNAFVFSEANLKRYQAIIFANSNNEAFENDEQRAAFQKFLLSGGAFIGIHSSTGSERTWNWFQQMQGGKFLRHSPLQTFTIRTVDRSHPATRHFPPNLRWTDECYFFTNVNAQIRVLLTVELAGLRDSKLASAPGEKVNGLFPLAWCQETDGGRRFYTSLGHKVEHYSDPVFRNHLRGGIRWALRLEDHYTPTVQP
jgi:type 1 glutamine amidotransferase